MRPHFSKCFVVGKNYSLNKLLVKFFCSLSCSLQQLLSLCSFIKLSFFYSHIMEGHFEIPVGSVGSQMPKIKNYRKYEDKVEFTEGCSREKDSNQNTFCERRLVRNILILRTPQYYASVGMQLHVLSMLGHECCLKVTKTYRQHVAETLTCQINSKMKLTRVSSHELMRISKSRPN